MEVFWDQATQADWECLANRANAPMQQRWIYGAVHEALGGQVFRAVVFKNGHPVALCQCLCRRVAGVLNLSLATRGPVWLTDCDQRKVLTLIRRTIPLPHPRARLFTLAEVSPNHLIPLMTPATIALRTLPATRGSLHGKWRNALKKAERNGLIITHEICSEPALVRLLQADAIQQNINTYTALPAAFTQSWQALAPDGLRLFTARKEGRITASALFLRHGNTATYHIANSTPEGREVSAARLILWRAFQDFTANGLSQIDLGTIDTVTAPGLARFKLGTGAEARKLGPTIMA